MLSFVTVPVRVWLLRLGCRLVRLLGVLLRLFHKVLVVTCLLSLWFSRRVVAHEPSMQQSLSALEVGVRGFHARE